MPKDTIYTYRLEQNNIPIEEVNVIANWSEKKIGYDIRHFQWKEKRQLAADIHSIYTASFHEEKKNLTSYTG